MTPNVVTFLSIWILKHFFLKQIYTSGYTYWIFNNFSFWSFQLWWVGARSYQMLEVDFDKFSQGYREADNFFDAFMGGNRKLWNIPAQANSAWKFTENSSKGMELHSPRNEEKRIWEMWVKFIHCFINLS